MFEIPAGGRRYRALERLVKQKRLARTAPVPCIVRTDGLAEEDSLAENVQRAPLHPLDQFRAFQAMREKGRSEEEIAAAFFVSASVVRQRLKLAAVPPSLLEAYAEEEMTLDQLMAFTVNPDHERQEQVWEALKRHYSTRKGGGRSDPGAGEFILEPVADRFQEVFGLIPRRRMHKRGWIRFAQSECPDSQDWLVYQSKGSGTVNVFYDRAGALTTEERDSLARALTDQVPDGMKLSHGSDSTGRSYVGVRIPGFDSADTSNWNELREKLEAMTALMIEVAAQLGLAGPDRSTT